MQIAEHLQVEAIEQRAIVLPGDVAEKETIVVDGEAVAGLAVAVPHYAARGPRERTGPFGRRHQVRLRLAQDDFAFESGPLERGTPPG